MTGRFYAVLERHQARSATHGKIEIRIQIGGRRRFG
jgi:hypothetical protein